MAYQAGVNLSILHNLEESRHDATDNQIILDALKKTQKYWNLTLELYGQLDADTLAEFEKQIPPGLTTFAWKIKRDPIMSQAV